MFEERERRYRLVCLTRELDKVLDNIKKYDFLKIIGQYEKNVWTNVVVDSEETLNYNFVMRFNNEVDKCLGTFEEYEQYFD